eukprot:7097906-Pyramimonas_sp.AAC.1
MESLSSMFNLFFLFSGFMYLSGLLTGTERDTLTYIIQFGLIFSWAVIGGFVALDFFPVFSSVVRPPPRVTAL